MAVLCASIASVLTRLSITAKKRSTSEFAMTAHTIQLPAAAPATVLALGAYLKNTACWLEGTAVTWSTVHGDLGEPSARDALERSVEALCAGRRPDAVACDLHPDFHSTQLAEQLAARWGVPLIRVQHHHAHVAAVMAEGDREPQPGAVPLSARPVIGIALDGYGLGDDGGAWGGELLLVRGQGGAAVHERVGHLQSLPLPGGDAAARQPWRVAAAAQWLDGDGAQIEARWAPMVGAQAARTVRQMLDRSLNCPMTSSAGRWFDAAAGALGLSVQQAHEAEAAIALERCARQWLQDHPGESPGIVAEGAGTLDLTPVLRDLLQVGLQHADDVTLIGQAAARFHLTLAQRLAEAAADAAALHGVADVVLTGGCFHNRVLSGALTEILQAEGLRVHRQLHGDCGDAGLAIGQAWVAAWRHHLACTDAPAASLVEF